MKATLIISSIIILFISCTDKKQKSIDNLVKARQYFDLKKYKSSDSLCGISIRFDSLNLDAYLLKSKIKSAQKNYFEAITILKNLLIYNKKNDTIYFAIGQNYYLQDIEIKKTNFENNLTSQESLRLAILYFDSCLKVNPYYYRAMLRKSNSYHNLNDHQKAIAVLNKALEIMPDSLKLIFYRGVEKQQLGDKIGSTQDLNFSIKTAKLDSSEIATALRFLSFNYGNAKKYDSAIYYISKAINFNSKDYYPYNVRAEYFLAVDKKDSACQDFRKSADLGFMDAYESIKKYCK